MPWFFGALVIIQIFFWIYFIRAKRNISLVMTGVLGAYCIYSFIDAYLKYVYVDPCAGIDGCMNETGMIFIYTFSLMILIIIVSLCIYLFDRYNWRHDR